MGNKTVKKRYKLFFLLAAICFFGVIAGGTTFGQIPEADPFTSIYWKAVKPNTAMGFEAGKTYPGEAYWYSGNDPIPTFESKIKSGEFTPGGLKDAAYATDRAGIDCSGFVSQIWGYSKLGTRDIPYYSRPIKKNDLRARDVLNAYDDHVIMFDQWADKSKENLWVYQATVGSGKPSDPDKPGNMTIHELNSWSDDIEFSGHNYLPRRRGLAAPFASSIADWANGVPTRPTLTAYLKGPLLPESINSSTVILRENYLGAPHIAGSITHNLSDPDNCTITFTPGSDLEENTKYKFTITDAVKDLESRGIDGDRNNNINGDFALTFTTRPSLLAGFVRLDNWNFSQRTGSGGLSAKNVGASSTGDNIIDPKETFELSLTISNVGTQSASSVFGTLSTTSTVNITESTKSFGNLASGATASNTDKFVFSVPAGFTGNEIPLKLTIKGVINGETNLAELNFVLPVGTTMVAPPGANLSEVSEWGLFNVYKVEDNTGANIIGNGNGKLDFGDYQVNLVFYAGNSNAYPINARFELAIDTSKVILVDPPIKDLSIPAYSWIEVPYNIILKAFEGDRIATGVRMTVGGSYKDRRIGYIEIEDLNVPPPDWGFSLNSISPVDVFSPNGDGVRDVVEMHLEKFYFSPQISSVSLLVRGKFSDKIFGQWEEVSDFETNISGKLKTNEDYWIKWKGTNEKSGWYQYRFKLKYDGNSLYSWAYDIYLHKSSPQAENVSVSHTTIGMGAGVKGSTSFSFNLTDAADLQVDIKDGAGNIIKSISNEALSERGIKTYDWDCYDASGNLVPDGKYYFSVTINDCANPITYAVKEIIVDNPPQDFYLVTSTTEVLSPTKTYALSWTPASPYGPEWNHLKEYQVLGRKAGWTDFGVLKNRISPEVTSATIDLMVDDTWELKVRAIDKEGNWCDSDGTNSAGYAGDLKRLLTVKVDSTPPSTFWISYPWKDGQKFDAKDIPIVWDEAGDDNLGYYVLVVGTDPDNIHGSSIYSNTFSAAATREVWLKNLARGKYYIYMIAYDKAGHWRRLDGKTDSPEHDADLTYAWKERWPAFEVATAPPSSFSLAEPYSGQYFDTRGEIKIAWNEPLETNLDRYELVIGTDPADLLASAVYFATFEASASRESKVKFERGIYYISLTAFDKDGNWRNLKGECNVRELSENILAAWPSFEVDPIPPGIFTVSNIYDGQYFDDRNVKIEWNGAPDKDLDRYEVYIGENRKDIIGSAVFTATVEAIASRECFVNLPGGVYWISIRAYDKLGNFRGLDGKTNALKHDQNLADNLVNFEIDHTPPTVRFDQVSFLPLSNPHFSPNGDNVKDNTTIRFGVVDDTYYKDFSATTEVRVEILDGNGKSIKKWEYPKFPALPGWAEIVWDGKSDSGKTATDGVYKVRIMATDKALNTATDESLTVVVDNTPPEVKNIANSGIFSPNGDGKFDTDTLNFGISDNLSETVEAAIEVISPEGQSIWNKKEPRRLARLPDGQVAGSDSVSVIWDGTADGGRLATDGTYRYRITATDQAGNTTVNNSTLVTVDSTPPAFTNVSTNPKNEVTFTNTSGRLDFSFRVSELANVGLTVYDSNHSLLHDTLVTAEPGTTQTISWNGKDTFGEFVPDNTYVNYTFAATDRVANSSSYRPTQVVKVNTPVTGLAGNILYSPDGMVKIIIPSGAVPEKAELYIADFDTAPESYRVNGKDNVTLTYKLGSRGSTNEVVFKKTPVLVMQYDTSVLKFENQTIELWRRGSGWSRLFGNTSGNIYTAYVDKTSDFALFADLTQPPPPIINQPESPTRAEKVTISGTSEPLSKVDLWINGLKRSPPIEVGASGTFTADIVLTEGANTIRARATDQTGNESPTSEAVTVVLDRTPPAITLTSPQTNYISPNGDGIQDEATISVDTDGVSIAISVRDSLGNILASSSSNTLTWGDASASEGTYNYLIKAFDEVGNEARKQGQIIVDKTRPEAYLAAEPITYIMSGNLSLFGIAEDANFERYILEYGRSETPSSWTEIKQGFVSVNYQKLVDFDTAILEDGIYSFRLRSYDKAGNARSSSLSKHVINSELYGSITSPVVRQVVRRTIEINGSITGSNFAEYRVEYGAGTNPTSWITITRSTALPAGSLLATWDTTGVLAGTYTLRLNVINIGNRSAYYTVPLVIDNTPPTLIVTAPSSGEVLGGEIVIDGQTYDTNFKGYKVEYSNGAGWSMIKSSSSPVTGSVLATWNTSGLNGSYTLKITSEDQGGNVSTRSVSITVDNGVSSSSVAITFPTEDSVLKGTVDILGRANDENFKEYKVEYGEGISPVTWTTIGTIQATSVADGLLSSWGTTGVSDGTYTIKLTVIDLAGNGNTDTVKVIVDNSNPAISITSPAASNVLGGQIQIAGNITDANFKEYIVEYGKGSAPATWETIQGPTYIPADSLTTWNTGSLNGNHTIRLTAIDQAGNVSSSSVSIIVDNIKPSASISAPQTNDILGGTITISGTAKDQHFSNYKLEYGAGTNPGIWTEITNSNIAVDGGQLGSWNTSGLGTDGIYTVRLTVADQAGNTNEARQQVVIDNTSPTASIDLPVQNSVLADTIAINGTALDEAHFKEYQVEYGLGNAPTSWTQIGTVHSSPVAGSSLEVWDTTSVADGTYTLKLTVKDSVNNTSSSRVRVIVDNTSPTVSLNSPSAGSYLAGAVNIGGTIFDANLDHYVLEYRKSSSPESWNVITVISSGQSISNGSVFNWADAAGLNGDYVIRARAYDKTGKTTSAEVAVTLDNTPPAVSLTSPNSDAVVSGSINLVGQATDLNLESFTIKHGYGIQPTRWFELTNKNISETGTLYSWNTSGVKDGYYTIRVEARDKAGNKGVFEYILTLDNSPPVASIHSPAADSVVRGIVSVEGIACDADFTTYNFRRFEVLYGSGTNPANWTTIESLVVPKINETLTSWNTSVLADGTYTLKLRSQDISGSTETTRTVIVDNTLPTASITSPSQGQTISGSVNITGTASDTNLSEYKVYYKRSEAVDWTLISDSRLGTWNTIGVGDGAYSVKLWVKDKAGNEREILRDVTVNNVIAVVNDSASPATISPNGDGIDDVAKINYVLSENSPVTIKIYKKPQYNTYKWEAFGNGIRYPLQSFSYTINASGTDHPPQSFSYALGASGTNHPVQYFNYTLGASGTKYPPQTFGWRVDASGVETKFGDRATAMWDDDWIGRGRGSTHVFFYSIEDYTITDAATIFLTSGTCDGSKYDVNVYSGPIIISRQWAPIYKTIPSDGQVVLEPGTYSFRSPFTLIDTLVGGYQNDITAFSILPRFTYSVSASDPSSGSNFATIYRNGTITGNSYSVTLSPLYGGTITNKSISYSQTSNTGGVSSSRDSSGWSGNTCSGVINATYIYYPGDSWSKGSGTQSGQCDSMTEGNYKSDWKVKDKVSPEAYVEGIAWSLSAPTDPDVSLKFEDGRTSTSNGNQYVVAITSYTESWNLNPPAGGSGSCKSGPGSPTNYDVPISSIITSLPDKTDGFSFGISNLNNPKVSLRFSDTNTQTTSNYSARVIGSTSYSTLWSTSESEPGSCKAGPGNPTNYTSAPIRNMISLPSTADNFSFSISNNSNPNVSLRFSNGSTTTSNPDNYVIGSTSYAESWDTSKDPGVGSGGWIKSGEITLPFNYDENSQSVSVGYTPPSDVVLSSWTVSLKNPAGGSSADAALDGTPTASGTFKVKLADSMLVKSLQYNSQTSPGSQSIEWDGKDASGNYVADGDFIYYIYAGPNIVKKSGEIKVRRSSEISATSVSENYISPNGDGIKESMPISYTLSENASVIVEVSNKDGTVVKSFSASGNQGANSTSWDGRDASSKIVEDGEYTIKIKATHSNGTLRTRELKVVVDNNSLTAGEIPAEQIVSAGSDPVYSPDRSKIAYVKDISGKKQVFTLNLTTQQSNQLTSTGNNFQPAWLPDGTKLSYASDRSGNNDIWLMNNDGSNQKQVTSNITSETSPVFSPDGQKIAYASNRTGEIDINKWNIWTMGIDGKNPTQITADENTQQDDYPTWSPDGKKLVYASDRSGSFDIWSVNLDGSSKSQITSSPEAETTPTFCTDGLKIAYVRGGDIYIRRLLDNNEVKIATGENPSWSRDGTEIIYNSVDSKIYSKQVYAGALTGVITQPILNQTLSGLIEIRGTALDTNFDSYRIEYSPNSMPYSWALINQPNTPVNNGILGVWNTAVMPDGEYILRLTVNDKAGNSLQNSVVVNADNDNWKLTLSSLTQLTSSDAWDLEPAWSPDGTKLAFSSNRSGNYDIWVMNADGTGLRNLTNDPAYDSKPVWSPDGIRIAFVSDRSGNKDIWVVNADGSGTPQQLTNLTIIDTDPTWSPDGSKIAFASNRSSNFDIWVMNSSGSGTPIKLTSSEADDREPNWSQFGIAFTSDRSGNKEVWMIEDINNPNPFRLTSSEAEDKEPSWAPIAIPLSDGSSRPLITFTSTRNGNQDIYVMDTDGIDQSKSLTDYTNVDCNPAWSPDGRRIAFSSYRDGNYNIWAMNFTINTTALSVRERQSSQKPMLQKPADGSKVQTLRPTFEWVGVHGIADYRVELGKTLSWTAPNREFAKTISQNEAATAEPQVVYAIHEFDEGLDRGDWYWKIIAISGTQEIASDDTWHFTIEPDFTLSGVTNYPNPFNPNHPDPNHRTTKIRYRLSTDASEVKIRIYDITGSLVTELDGTTNGEGASIWNKYNDVEWDGRNGRGDMVMNGIYPFEVTARSGDKSVSGRGKIAVLK